MPALCKRKSLPLIIIDSQLTAVRMLKGNHANFVSVKVDDVVLCRVHRPLAKHFSAVWKRALQDPLCTVVTVTFPPEPPISAPVAQKAGNKPVKPPTIPPPAPLPSAKMSPTELLALQMAQASGNTPAKPPAIALPPTKPPAIPPPPPVPSNRDCLKFIVQWMEQGGADPKGNNVVLYPSNYRPGLQRLLALTTLLEVNSLSERIRLDLGPVPGSKSKFCPKCKRPE